MLTGCEVPGRVNNDHIESQERAQQEPRRAMVVSPPICPVHVVAKTLPHCQRSRWCSFPCHFLGGASLTADTGPVCRIYHFYASGRG